MTDMVSGVVTVQLGADASPSAQAPGWIKLAPRGRTGTRDGRSFSFNPEALAARFNADRVKIPVDFEHGTIHLAGKGQRSDAIGWIEEMEARTDGLYGRVEWLEPGRAALAARTHRYVSPVIIPDENGNATWLHSVALVTAPALAQMPELAQAGGSAKDVRGALGLPADADEATVVAAIDALKAKAGGVATANATVEALAVELSQERRTVLAARVNDKVEKAIVSGFITPGMRDWALLSCASDEASFDTFMEKVGPVFSHLGKETPGFTAARLQAHADAKLPPSTDAQRIAAQLGIDPAKLA